MSDAPVAIVTGGAQGLGAAIVKILLKQGYKVCIADIQECKETDYWIELQNEYGSKNFSFYFCDVTREDDYNSTFEHTLKAFGRVDVLVSNAGIVLEQNPEAVLKVNLLGPIFGCQTAIRYMGVSNGGKGGMIINTASIFGLLPNSSTPSYVASKHGVVGLTRSYGMQYFFEKDGVTFAALCPSFMDTPLLRNSKGKTLFSEELHKDYILRELLSPDEVAQGVLKLLEDRINGSTLLVTKTRGMEYVEIPEDLKEIFPIK